MTLVRIVQSQSVLGAALPRVLLQCFFVLLLRLGEPLLLLSHGSEGQEENAGKRDAPGSHRPGSLDIANPPSVCYFAGMVGTNR